MSNVKDASPDSYVPFLPLEGSVELQSDYTQPQTERKDEQVIRHEVTKEGQYLMFPHNIFLSTMQ